MIGAALGITVIFVAGVLLGAAASNSGWRKLINTESAVERLVLGALLLMVLAGLFLGLVIQPSGALVLLSAWLAVASIAALTAGILASSAGPGR